MNGTSEALHPVASEPVNYISSRSELMAAAGLLGGLLLYLYAGRRYWLLGLSSLCFAAGLLAKSVALALPLSGLTLLAVAGLAALAAPCVVFTCFIR